MGIYLFFLFFVVIFAVLNSPKWKGYIGELGVRRLLKKLKNDEFEVLHNIMLEKDGKTTQIDHIIIGRTGIFVVETKNYKGWILGSQYSDYWTQSIYKRKKRFQNPLHQNYGHIKFLEHHLQDYSGPYFSLIAFSKRGTLKNIKIISEDVHVIQSDEVLKVIQSKTVIGMSPESVKRVADIIREANCRSFKMGRNHVHAIQQNQKIKEENLKMFNRS